MTIDPQISDYIDIAIERERQIFRADVSKDMDAYFDKHISHHISILQEFWRHEFALMMEVTKDKPGREEVRDIARDELRYHGLHR